MKVLAQKPLDKIRAEEEKKEMESLQVQSLGFSLAQEKIKNIEKDKQIVLLGEQVASLTISQMALQKTVATLQGGK